MYRLEVNLAMQAMYTSQKNYDQLINLDDEFHQIFFAATGKMRTWGFLQNLNIHSKRMRLLQHSRGINHQRIVTEHKEICHLISRDEKEQVMNLMEHHLQVLGVEQDNLKEMYPNYFV